MVCLAIKELSAMKNTPYYCLNYFIEPYSSYLLVPPTPPSILSSTLPSILASILASILPPNPPCPALPGAALLGEGGAVLQVGTLQCTIAHVQDYTVTVL